MSGYERFYEESLYPLQNGILRTLAPVCGSVLSLTGGTALSRIYFHHRYSDDLDLFGNSVEHFNEIVETSLSALENAGYQFVKGSTITPNPDDFFKNLTIMALDILHTRLNSLAKEGSDPLF